MKGAFSQVRARGADSERSRYHHDYRFKYLCNIFSIIIIYLQHLYRYYCISSLLNIYSSSNLYFYVCFFIPGLIMQVV